VCTSEFIEISSFVILVNIYQAMDSVISAAQAIDQLTPVKTIESLAQSAASGFLIVSSEAVTWYIYFVEGKIFYANHSLDPFERLELNLRRTAKQNGIELDQQLYLDLRDHFTNIKVESFYPSSDYQALCALVTEKKLTQSQAIGIIQSLTKEALRSFLLLKKFTAKFVEKTADTPIIWSTNFLMKIKECQDENDAWKALGPAITSSHQRPYLINGGIGMAPEARARLNKILVGFDFHQLSLVINQDSLDIAKSLHKLLQSGVVGLWEPRPPLDRLPKTYVPEAAPVVSSTVTESFGMPTVPIPPVMQDPPSRVYRIVCIDDSPTVLREMDRFLDSDVFQIFPIVDSATALMKIMRVSPDIILMDVGMPNIDGYKLCAMLRRNSMFKKVPIVMVTGNTGLIDRAKAKMSGCTDYMTKPFTQASLIEMVFKHILE
jgi:two-component system, chemotaxis family, response regulator PixG